MPQPVAHWPRFGSLRRQSVDAKPSEIGRHDVIDDVLVEVKVTSGRHQYAAGQLVESARADLDAEPRREPRRHVNAHFEETRDAGQICPAGLA